LKDFDYSRPTSLQQAIRLLRKPGAKAVAGGTDLLLQIRQGEIQPSLLVDISELAELHGILAVDGKRVRIGAVTPLRDLETSSLLRRRFPALSEAAALIGSVQIRNLGTLGGNLCNAAPSADMAPPLLALDATALIAGPNGHRSVRLDDFFLGPGKTALARGELLLALELKPLPARSGCSYQRITIRKRMDIAFVGVASLVVLDHDGKTCRLASIALGSVAPTPIRAPKAEALLVGKALSRQNLEAAATQACQEAQPISDLRASAEYRREIVKVLVRRTLIEASRRALATET